MKTNHASARALRLGCTMLGMLLLSACSFWGTPAATEATPTTDPPPAVEPNQLPTPPDSPPAAETPIEEPPAPMPSALGAERQLLSFTTADGRSLEGYFYPAKNQNAPVIVLMHWAPGTMEDWDEIARWLQNRKDETANPAGNLDRMVSRSRQVVETWKDPSWFPVLPAEVSFAVLTFNFGGRGNSQEGGGTEGLLQDALAALSAAGSLPGVDRNRITAAGASIGADASANSCEAFNKLEVPMGTCLGAFSISPGNYLGLDYGQTIERLQAQDPAKRAVCLAAASDGDSLLTCLSGTGDYFSTTAYEGGDHGMELIRPNLNPNPLTLLVQFLEAVYGIPLSGS